MKKTKRKLRRLQFFSWFFLLSPIAGVLIYNAKDYFTLEQGFVFPQAVEIGLGTTLALVAGGMLALGKTNAFKGSKGLLFTLLLAVLLKSILNDIILILSALSAGSIIHSAFKPSIVETKKILDYEKQGGIQAQAMKNVFNEKKEEQEIVRSGRA